MAQTIEEIGEILKTLKLDTEISAEETEKVLASINSKMESISDDYVANQLLKDYLVDLKKELDVRHDFHVSKYGEFEKAFNVISNAQSSSVKLSDLDDLLAKVNANLASIQNTFLDKSGENFRNITGEMDKLNTFIDKVNDEVSERITLNFDTTRDLIESINQEISKQHEALRLEKQASDENTKDVINSITDNIHALSENIALQTGNYCELLEMRTSDIKDFINTNSSTLVSLQNASENKLTEKLNVLENLSHGFEANIIDVNNNLQSIIQNLMAMDPTVQNDIIKRELENIYMATNGLISSMQIFDQKNDELAKMVSHLATNENFATTQEKLAEVIKTLNDFGVHIKEISTGSADIMSTCLKDIAVKMDGLSSNLLLKADENAENLSAVIDVLGAKVDFVKNYLSNEVVSNFADIKEMNESLKDFVNEINETYRMSGQALGDGITTKLFELQKSFVENVECYYEKLAELKTDSENFNQEFVEILSGKTEEITVSLDSVKTSLQAIIDSDLSTGLFDLKSQLSDVYTNVTTQMQINSGQNQTLVESLDKLYNDTIGKIDIVNENLTTQMQNDLDTIKYAIEAINQNISANSDENFQIMEDLRVLMGGIDEKITQLSSSCTGAFSNVAVDIANALNSSLEKVSEDLKNYMGAPVSANDLVWTVDNIKNELAAKLAELASKLSSKEDDIDTKEGILLTLNQLSVRIEELSTKYSSDDFNEILSNNKLQLMSALKDLKNIILIAMKEIAKSSASSMDVLHEKVDALLQNETTNAFGYINEKVDGLVENNDKITNSLVNIAEKFSGLRQNTQELAEGVHSVNEKIDEFDEKFNRNEMDVRQSLAEFEQKFEDFAFNDGTIVKTMEVLSDKIDVFKFNTNNDHIVSSLDTLHEKLSDCYSLNDKISEAVDVVSAKIDTYAEADDQIETTLQMLHEKITALSEKDTSYGFDVESEIKNIKSMISTQRKFLEDTEINDRTLAMDECLQDLQKKIDDIAKNALGVIDLNANANEIRESLMAAIANVFEQVSFVEETEEIKGFVEEKTDEIYKHIKDIQNQLKQIASSSQNDDYSYSLQDVESDIAKLRLILNDISEASPNDEFVRFRKDFEKINEDIVSISTRTNTLLLNSDNSYKSLSDGIDVFKGMVSNLNEKINYLDNTELQKSIERKIASINNAMISSANSNKVIREVLMYLGEWMDTTTENINALCEKTSSIDNVYNEIDSVKSTIDELKNYVPEKSSLIKVLEDKFEEQESRIDRLEMKLEKLLEKSEDTDDTKLNKKVDKIEKLINKLNDNVEKLASYVDEE